MGDWHTLHLFDHTKFSRKVVPELKEKQFLEQLFDLAVEQYWLRGENRERRIAGLLELSAGFSEEGFREAVEDEVHADFNCIVTLTLFRECALFNPHFRLGKSLLFRCIRFEDRNTIAESLLSEIRSASSLGYYGFGIQGWLSPEDVKLLLLDSDKMLPVEPDDGEYIAELRFFLQTAADHGLGVVSGMNMNESSLAKMPSPLKGTDFFSGLELNHLITYNN